MMSIRTIVGIDPGVSTGFAIAVDGKITVMQTWGIVEAMAFILDRLNLSAIELVIEDPRGQYVPPSQREPARIKGVGSVERDCKIWIEFAEFYSIPYRLVKPGKYRKIDAKTFRQWTGWEGRTSEHARAAAMMVWQGTRNAA